MTSARQLARCYDRYVASLRRGDFDAVTEFVQWLAAYWDEGPPEPTVPPTAVSPIGAAGRAVHWYDRDGTIFGYVVNAPRGCYQVPAHDTPPQIGIGGVVRAAPWRQYGPRV